MIKGLNKKEPVIYVKKMGKDQITLRFIALFAVFTFIILFFSTGVFSVGIAHGDTTINFEPNLVVDIPFTLRNIKSGAYLNLSVSGDLAKYASINKVDANGSFVVTLKLPDKIEKPGTHTILLSAREIPNATAGGTIMAVTAVRVPILIKVPYPEKYVEISLDISDAKVGEPVDFTIFVVNLGEEDLTSVKATIEIYSPDGKKIATLDTEEKSIKATVKEKLNAQWMPKSKGLYKAIATVDYDEKIAKTEKTFMVGMLYIEIIGWTKEFQIDTINPFDIEIKSEWNDEISNVYAEIIITDEDETQIASLKTPSVDINPWEKKTVTAYWNTKGLDLWVYNANITLYYADKTTEKIVKIQIVEKLEKTRLPSFTVTYMLVAICTILTFWYFKKKEVIRKKSKEKGEKINVLL